MRRLERALNDAFDGVDAPVLSMTELAAIPPESWAQLSFVCHPTAACLDVHANVGAIWTALKAGKEPPPCTLSKDAARILVWRHDSTSMFRELTAEEAMMWEETAKGTRFGDLCEMLATYDDPPGAPARAAGYLKGWLDAGLLSEAVPGLERLSELAAGRRRRAAAAPRARLLATLRSGGAACRAAGR